VKARDTSTAQRSPTHSDQRASKRPSILETWQDLVSPDEIIEAGRRLGVIKRQRKVDLPALVEATIAAMTAVPGAETTALSYYLGLVSHTMAPSSFYDRFTEEFAELMGELAHRAIARVRAYTDDERTRDLGVLCERFADIRVVDSTCHLLNRLAQGWAPSTSKKRPAGIKLHTVIALRDNLPVGEIRTTPQRRHDNAAMPAQAIAPGVLTLFDLGYIDVKRFIDMTESGAFFVTRLKESHNPEIVRMHIGLGSRREARGMRLDDALGYVVFHDRGVIDLDVRITHGKRTAVVRAVATVDEEGTHCWYLTNVAREVLSVPDVAATYRLRWDIELFFKHLKSGAGWTAVLAWRPSAIQAFLFAKVIALCLARLLEIAVADQMHGESTGQLALLLVLVRSVGFFFGLRLRQQGLTVEEMEQRILNIASIVAKQRNRRRARARRQREAGIGASG
jgi:hypothetical protein